MTCAITSGVSRAIVKLDVYWKFALVTLVILCSRPVICIVTNLYCYQSQPKYNGEYHDYWGYGNRTCILIEKLEQEQNKSDEFPVLKKPVRHGRYGIINSQLCSFDRSVWSALFMAMLTVRNAMSRAEICPLSILFQFFRYRHLSALVNHIKYRFDGGALPLIVIIQGVGNFCLD